MLFIVYSKGIGEGRARRVCITRSMQSADTAATLEAIKASTEEVRVVAHDGDVTEVSYYKRAEAAP